MFIHFFRIFSMWSEINHSLVLMLSYSILTRIDFYSPLCHSLNISHAHTSYSGNTQSTITTTFFPLCVLFHCQIKRFFSSYTIFQSHFLSAHWNQTPIKTYYKIPTANIHVCIYSAHYLWDMHILVTNLVFSFTPWCM